jgi:hypothetical protein
VRERNSHRGHEGNRNAGSAAAQEEVAFVQQANAEPPIEEIQCYNCQQMGHYTRHCELPFVRCGQSTGVQLFQRDVDNEDDGNDDDDDDDDDDGDNINFTFFHLNDDTITITPKHMINQNWVLLDSESTVNIFSNKNFLKNIRRCNTVQGLRMHSNGGFQDTHMIGDLPGFGPVWYNKGSLKNILSLAAVQKICLVTIDTLEEAAIVVHKHNGDKMKFLESSHGLYYYDTKAKTTSANYWFINSVQENKSLYTKQQLKNADLATRVYELVGRPSHANFTKEIRENQLQNCTINVHDANYTNVDALRGRRTTRTTPDHAPSNQIRPLPSEILETHRDVTLCFDIFFVDRLAFVGTVAQRSLHFLTVEYIKNRTIRTHVFPCLRKVHNMYKARGFKITMTHADEEFTTLRYPLLELDNIGLNIAATNEHVTEIERAIRTIKERNRSTVSGLPYKHYPTILKKALVSHAVSLLNMFPHTDGVSAIMSPRTILIPESPQLRHTLSSAHRRIL